MESAAKHKSEALRIAELLRFDVLDTEDEQAFDELTELASSICGTPISLITLIDEDRQWFKSRLGIDTQETPRELAFCAHAILQDEVFEIPNALDDSRFADNPLVTEDPSIRFYAGAPLITKKGLPIGTLCVADKETKQLTDEQKRILQLLANQVMGQLELRLNYKKLKRVDKEREKIFSVIGHDLRSPFNGIIGLSRILNNKAAKMDAANIQHMAGSILSASLLVYQVLDELMQWTQQRLGRTISEPKPCDLPALVNQTTDLLKDAIDLKQLSCDVSIEKTMQIMADEAILKTILRNLIANAIKYSNEGGVIRIAGKIHEAQVIVTVEDQGVGVSAEVIEQLFKNSVESQLDTQGIKGSGIGLSLCAELISTQNGKIWVDETFTQGARIQFSLPLFQTP